MKLPADFAGWADEPQGVLNLDAPQPPARPTDLGAVDAPVPPPRPADLGMGPVAVQNPPEPPARPPEFGPSAKLPPDFAGWADEAPGIGEVAVRALGKGMVHGYETGKQGTQVLTEGGFTGLKPQEAGAPDAVDEILRKPLADGWKDPNWWTAQILHGLGGSWPALGAGIAGGAAGGAFGGPLGALGGSAGGFGAGSALQALAPSYLKARQEGLEHDKAVDRALIETGIAGAVGTAMGAAPAFRPFKQAIADSMLMLFGTAPALMSGQRAAENVVEGKPIGEGVPEAAALGIGTGALLGGAHAVARGVAPKRAGVEGPAPGSVDDFLRQANEAQARAAGARTKAEIDEFIRQKEAQDAVREGAARQLPAPGGAEPAAAPVDQNPVQGRPTDRNDAQQPGPSSGTPDVSGERPNAGAGAVPTGEPVSPAVEPTRAAEDAALRNAGWIDEDIASMSTKQRKSELEAAGYVPPKVEEAPAAKPATFQTAKGSTYVVHEDGTTTRDKAARPDAGHEGDSGIKKRSEKTIYIDDRDASASLTAAGLQGLGEKGARVAIKDGRATLLTWNEKAGRWGAMPGGHKVQFSEQPGIGKFPLELWNKADDVPGHLAFSNMHAGNAITSLGDAAPQADGSRARPVKVESPEDLAPARDRVNQEPSEAQIAAGNYAKGHAVYDGLPVSIENPKGSTRRGVSPDGSPWEVAMPGDYGYIKGSKGADKDHVDILIGDKPPNGKVFVVDQHDPATSKFDEHKVIAGVDSVGEAARLYSKGFSDGSGPGRIGAITEVPTSHLQEWLAQGQRKKPMAPPPAKGEAKPADAAPEETKTLYRFEPRNRKTGKVADWVRESDAYKNMRDAEGRWFAETPEEAEWYKKEHPDGHLVSVDIPASEAERYRVSNMPKKAGGKEASDNPASYSARPENEFFLPRKLADKRLPVSKDWEAEGRKAYEKARERMVPDGLKGEDARAWERGNWAAQREAQRKYVEAARKRAENRMPTTLVQFLRGMGGVRDDGGDLKSQDMHKRFIGLVSSRGVSLDQAREAAAEAGYLGHDKERAVSETTVSDLLDALMDHPRYSTDDEQQVYDVKEKLAAKKHERAIGQRKIEIESFMKEHSLSPDAEAVERAAVLMQDDGLPMEEAFERAVMQLAHETPETRAALDETTEDGFDAIPWDEWTGPVAAYEEGQEAAARPTGGGNQAPRGEGQKADERGETRPADGRPAEPESARADQAPEKGRDVGDEGEPGGREGAVAPTEEEQHAASRKMEDALDAIEVAQESGDRSKVLEAARNAKRVLAEAPEAITALDPEYWAQFPAAIKRMSAPGYKPTTPPEVAAEPTVEPGAEGKPQTVIPGAEQISQGALAQKKADEGLKPAVPQKGAGGMFDEAETAPQLFDAPSRNHDKIEKGEVPVDDARERERAEKIAKAEAEGLQLTAGEPTATKPEPKITVEDAVRITKARAKNDPLLSNHVGEYTAVATRESPWGTERGFGETALDAQHDARRRLGMKDWKAIGAEAFKNGDMRRVPVSIAGYPYEATLWQRGWDQANLAEPVPGVDMPGRPAAPEEPPAQNKPAAAPEAPETKAASAVEALRDRFLDRNAEQFPSIVQARKFMLENGFKPVEGLPENKQIEEAIEHALVLAAREIVARGNAMDAGAALTFDKLVNLYERQPRLGSRTSTSVAEQAYSTPVPLAYVASRLAGIDPTKTVLEPTAGNGALLIEADPKKAAVNELNKTRADALEAQGYRVMMRDAADPDRFADVPKVDVVIANPPFGAVREGGESKTFRVPGLNTTAIDYAIALNALEAMKPDGRAVLILGGVKAESLAERQKGYMSPGKRKFFHVLLNKYNVADIFTVSGDLYERQGAGWPVDVVVIDGKGKSDRKPLTAEPPPLLKTWGEIKEKLNGAPERGVLGDSGETPRAPDAAGGKPARDDAGSGEPAIRGELAEPQAAEGQRTPVGAKPDRGQPADAGRSGVGDQPRPAAEQVRERPRVDYKPDPERGRPVKANSAGQVDYRPSASAGRALGSLLPANLRTATEKSLDRVQRERGQIDQYVADALGYDLDQNGMFFRDGNQTRQPFSAEQIDAIGLALDNIEKGDGFILGDQCVAGETLIYDPVSRTHAQIGALAAAGRPIVVLSLTRSGFKPTVASAPFYKGVADLFRVTLDDGSSIVVTAGHRFLTEEGWASIRGGLKAGAQIVTDACEQAALSLDSVVSSLPPCAREDDRRSSHTIRDSILHCSPGRRRGDEQSLSAEEADQVFAPSQDDVRGHSLLSSREDGPALSEERSRHRQSPGRPSRNSSFPSESRALSQSATREPALCVSGSAATLQEIAPFPRETAALHQEASAVSTDRHEATDHRLSFSSVDHTGLRRVVFIAYERTDKFYDMHVPATHNYVANHVVNHNTGIGKGRVVAAAIRYAHRKGLVPVFVTEKPDLFGDMWRDLHDIGWPQALGRPINMFMTNSGIRLPLDEKAVEWVAARNAAKDAGEPLPPMEGQFSKSQTPETSAKRMAAILSGEDTPDVVFTTYDQMNSVRGQETDRRSFLRRVAPKAFLILDEAHNAGGQGEQMFEDKDKAAPRSVVFREAVTAANSVLYSSATYAKSPKVMDLFSRTDMAKAVEDPKDLAELIEKGGIPLQQIVSQMLSDAGQYMRRERSFEGVTYEPEIVPVDEASYETFTDALGTIFRFDRSFAKERGEIAQAIAQELGAGIGKDSGVGEGGASSVTFSAIMHNAISQMVLSIKAKGAAQRAIQAIEAGEKPVIALSATMESFLGDMAEALGLKPGDPINADFGDVLRRYMERTRRVTIKMPDDTKKHVMIPLSDMSPGARADFEDASKFLKSVEMPGLPLSPIDAIRSELQKAGYSVREITGRSLMIDYTGDEPVLAKRPEAERGSTGKRLTIKAFNDGKLDAVILNRSGSTGVSMHASEFFKDRRKRRMILVQADPNIDTHMQMLGRIHRTGQVELPAYTQLAADIPAEVRPTAVLMGKMASLNANTTASRKSKFTGESVDFMNKYGDLVAAQALSEPEMAGTAATLDVDIKNDNGEITPGLIAKVTGRLTLLRPKDQQALIDRISEDYKALIARLDAEGLNDLEAKSVDLQARVVESKEIKPATGNSPFTSAVNLDKVSVKAQGRAMAPGEVLSELADRLDDHANADADFASELGRLAAVGGQRQRATVGQVTQAAQVYAKKQIAALKKSEAIRKAQDDANAILARWQHTANSATPGSIIGINFAGDDMPAIVLDFRFKGKEGSNPVALSQWVLDLALPNQLRTLSIPASQVYTAAFPKDEKAKGGLTISRETFAPAMVEAQFENARKEGRETRFIFTGNILAAFDQADGRGQILNFTMEDGSSQPGILMNRKFDPADFMAGRAIRFKTGAQALAFLDKFPRGEISSKGEVVTIRTANGRYEFDLPAAKATGGRFFTDAKVRQVYDNWEKRGSRMRATVAAPTARALVDAMMDLGAAFETRENQAAAQEIVNADAKAPQMAQAAPAGWGTVEGDPARSAAEVAQIRTDVARIIDQTLPPGSVRHAVVDTIHDVADDVKQRSGGSAQSAVAGLYQAGVDKLIEVSTRNSGYPKNTAYHEAWHAAQDLGLANERELAVLRSPVEVRRLRDYAARKKHPEYAAAMSQIELEANFFGDYAAARDEGREPPRLHASSMGVFARLYDLLRRIRNYLAGRGFQITEDIAARFQRGEMRDRPFWDRGESRLYGKDVEEPARFAQAAPPEERYFGKRPLTERIAHRMARLPDSTDRVEAILDFNAPVEVTANELAEGRRIAPEIDPYKAKRLLPGRTAATQDNFKRDYLEPLVHAAKQAGLSLQDIAEWLYAQHAPERNAAMDQIDPKNGGKGSGITDERAGQIIDRLTREGKAGSLENIARRVAEIREYNLDLAESAGLMSEEQANELRAQYENYVPLKGWDDPSLAPEEALAVRKDYVGGRMRVAGREFIHAFGRKTIPSDPLSNLINDTYRMIDRAEKNRTLNTIWRFFRSIDPDVRDGIVKMDKGRMVKAIDPQTGMMVWREEAAWRFRENVVPLKIGGKPHYLVFEDPELAKAFMRTSAYQLPFILKQMGQIVNTAKSMWTHWNPDFMVRHFFVRYPIEGASNAGEHGFLAALRSFKGYPGGPAYRAIRRHQKLDEAGRAAAIARLSDPNTTMEEKWLGYYEELRRNGGLMNWADFGGVDRVRKRLDSSLATLSSNPARAALAYGRAVHEGLNVITSAMDNAQRLAAYVEARQAGAGRVDAAMAAREATVDFARKGLLANYMTLWKPFANTAAQTASRMVRATRRSKGAMAGVLASWVALGLSAGLFAYLFGGNDKDGKPFIEKIGDWTRRLNITVPFGLHDDKGRPYMLTLPMPYNYALPFTIGQTIAALIMKAMGRSKEELSHIMGNLMHSALEAFTPVAQENSLLGKALPELSMPFLHVATNKNWYGGIVHPNEDRWNKGIPKSEVAFRNTPEAWKMLARGMQNYTGFDAHPEDYREVMSYFTSTLQGVAARAGTAARDAAGGEKPDPTDVPVLHALTAGGKQYDASDRRDYFEGRDKAYSMENQAKRLRKDAAKSPADADKAREYQDKNAKDIAGAKTFRSIDATRGALTKQMDRVKADTTISAEEKNRRMKVLQDRELEIMRRARAMSGE